MKSIFIVLLAAALCGRQAFAQKKSDAPGNVTTAFAKSYAGATKVKWELEDGLYEASFAYKGKDMSVTYAKDATVTETETKIAVSELPAKAQQYAAAQGKIKGAARIVLANGTVQYEAERKGKDLMFDSKGDFIREKVEKD